MTVQIDKTIEQLQAQIDALKEKKEREENDRKVLEKAYEDLKNALHAENLTLDTFLRFAYRDVKRVVVRMDKERAKDAQTAGDSAETKTKAKATSRKKGKTTKKPARKAGRKSAKAKVIKIPAGRYTNIPPEPADIITVAEKGPRPRRIKEHAESIGDQEKFLAECRMPDA